MKFTGIITSVYEEQTYDNTQQPKRARITVRTETDATGAVDTSFSFLVPLTEARDFYVGRKLLVNVDFA